MTVVDGPGVVPSPDQASALQTIHAALSHAITVDQVAQVLVVDAAVALGADTSGLWVLSEDRSHVELVRHRNYSEASRRVVTIMLDGGTPAPVTDVLRTGEPIFLSRRPAFAALYPEIERFAAARPEMAIACLPLHVSDQPRASLALTFDRAMEFSPGERAFYRLLAATFGQALARARLYEAERAAKERLAVLAEVSETLSSSLDYETTLQAVVQLAMPLLADFGFFDVVEGERDDQVRRIARAHDDPQLQAILDGSRWVRSTRRDRNLCALSWGESGIHPTIDDDWMRDIAESPEHLALLRELGFCSMITVPLHYQGRLLGALTLFYAGSHRHHTAADLSLAEELARRAAAAVENARLVRELQAANAVARVADRRKDEFLAMLGHELRNPLAPIQTALDLMRLRDQNALDRERQVIERQVIHLVRLVDDLIDISRVTRGLVALKRQPVQIAEVVAAALEMSSPLFEQQQHQVAVELTGEDAVVLGDRVRLAQVVGNLLSNAARYTPPGGHITVSAARERGEVVLVVRDDGVGLAPDLMPVLFEPFVQGPRGSDRSQGGLGVGLALVRSLVDMHGGSVAAHSDGIGKGARFEVRLPLATSAARESTPREFQVAVDAAGCRVLVVDDNPDAVETLEEALRLLGYQVMTARDGPSAMRVAREQRPMVALLDIGLPVMDGHELALKLREMLGPGLHLIAITGYGQEHDRERSAAAGFSAHLVKPVQLEAVVRAISRRASSP